MTSKEALTRLYNQATRYFKPNDEKDQMVNKRFGQYKSIIEKELKEYESMKQIQIVVCDKKISDDDLEKLKNQRLLSVKLEPCEVKPLFDETTEKKLKALEIIKDFIVIEPHCIYGRATRNLTQEEYDLLKEWLCEKKN